jgi:tryptophan-rich sensory protein
MIKLVVFFVLNFSALFIGSLFMPNPAIDNWYLSLNKAPWTPPGWVFGFAWFTVMFCFSVYMYFAVKESKFSLKNKLITLYALQWLLNVLWNPVFFCLHQISWAFIILLLLLMVLFYILRYTAKSLKYKKILITPYIIWLCIAVSLNLYIVVNN